MSDPKTPAPAAPSSPKEARPYDMSIHSNPDAGAWARFFVETYNRNQYAAPGEDMMIGWFANAMCAAVDARASPACPKRHGEGRVYVDDAEGIEPYVNCECRRTAGASPASEESDRVDPLRAAAQALLAEWDGPAAAVADKHFDRLRAALSAAAPPPEPPGWEEIERLVDELAARKFDDGQVFTHADPDLDSPGAALARSRLLSALREAVKGGGG